VTQVFAARREALLPVAQRLPALTERGEMSQLITSNKPFAEWAHIFAGDPVMASAALDRLLHRATIINIKGESYRLKDKRKAGLFPSLQHKPEKTSKS
jgi:IstB-like ATP binding protein